MKRISFLFLATVLMTAVSCLKEEMPQPQEEGIYFTFEAVRDELNAPTKTVLVDNNKVEWVKNDKVGVYNGINETHVRKEPYHGRQQTLRHPSFVQLSLGPRMVYVPRKISCPTGPLDGSLGHHHENTAGL